MTLEVLVNIVGLSAGVLCLLDLPRPVGAVGPCMHWWLRDLPTVGWFVVSCTHAAFHERAVVRCSRKKTSAPQVSFTEAGYQLEMHKCCGY